MKTTSLILVGFTVFSCLKVNGQDLNKGEIHGNFQMDIQSYRKDSLIGAAAPPPEKVLTNGYANLIYTNGNFSAGVRYESYLNHLQGYPDGYQGSGIPYRYATYSKDGMEVTVGNYYEQFGSGLILRTYEERNLGLDNALDGIRVKYQPAKGIYLKGIWGKQRKYFTTGEGIVRGADAEFNVNEILTSFAESKTKINVGGSIVSKYQKNTSPTYNLPENVAAFAGRLNVMRGKVTFNSEYAFKANDPSFDNTVTNGNIPNFKTGNALMVSTSYSQKGLGVLLGAKRIDNMSFRSERDAQLTEVNINFLPPITKQHTYQLVAFYPYATQPLGEMGFQGEVFYSFKPNTRLGGKYGTNVSVNFSHINNIDTLRYNDERGYKSDYFKTGDELFFQDLNLEITKKWSSKLKTVFTIAKINYNNGVLKALPSAHETVYANAEVLEIFYKLTSTQTIRTELQALNTKQDRKNWAMVLVEYTVAPHWFAAVQDLYNYGNDDVNKRIHYYNLSAGYMRGANRIAVGYGKQREGIFCVGGVCRNVPASNGFSLSITSSF